MGLTVNSDSGDCSGLTNETSENNSRGNGNSPNNNNYNGSSLTTSINQFGALFIFFLKFCNGVLFYSSEKFGQNSSILYLL